MQQDFDLKRFTDILRRRYLLLFVPAVVIFVGASVVAYKLPRLYEASAKILVESQQIPTSMASSTVTANALERIQTIQQRLMTRENLQRIAAKFSLFGDEQNPASPTGIVDMMRNATSIEQIDVNGGSGAVIGFTVSFRYSDAAISSRVANEFVTLILSQNLQTRLSRAEETSKFFQQELARLDHDLKATEERIGDFKRANEGALPDTLPIRRTLVLQLEGEIAELDRQIRRVSASTDMAGNPASEKLRQLDHSLRTRQLDLESIQKERESLGPLAEKGYVAENRIRELDRAISAAELDIGSIKLEIAAAGATENLDELNRQRATLEQRLASLNEDIVRTPQVEVELSALTRDYSNLQEEYRQAKAKVADASTGERLEEDRQAERFDVIEQATVPESAVKPNRPRIMMAGGMGGIVVGLALVLLVEMLTKCIRTVSDLERALQLRPIAAIPYVTTSSERRTRRLRFAATVSLVLVTAGGGLALVHTYYLPLDLLAGKVAQKVGL